MPLSEVNNRAAKEFVAKMSTEEKKGIRRFAPKSITNYVQVIEMVVGSALNDKGEAIYPVKWNHNFTDLPQVGEQKKPAFTSQLIPRQVVTRPPKRPRTLNWMERQLNAAYRINRIAVSGAIAVSSVRALLTPKQT